MNPALAVVAIAVVGGAVVAVSGRDARVAVLGLTVAMVVAPTVVDPLPSPTGLAARLVGAILAGYLLWIVVRAEDARTGGSRLGWPAELALAAAAAATGYGTYGLGAPALGPVLAQAAGFALAALAVIPLLTGRDLVRVGIGLLLLAHGALLVRVGLGGTPSVLEALVTTALVVGIGGTVAALAAAIRTEDGRFELGEAGRVRISVPRRRVGAGSAGSHAGSSAAGRRESSDS